MLELRDIHGGYGTREVLSGVTAAIPAGRITVIAGPNGCGKSTLLKTIAGILPASSGSVCLDGRELRGEKPGVLAKLVAYLPQNRPVPEITAERLVLHGRFPYLSYPRRYRQADLEIARRCMARLGIADLADRFVPTLSGGQRQKVYIAMALAQDTPVVLLDEPTTYLDISHQLQLMEQARFLADSGKTVVLVLHDLAMALRRADNLIVLGSGRVLSQGSPEAVFSSGCLPGAFGVRVERVRAEGEWQYYYR